MNTKPWIYKKLYTDIHGRKKCVKKRFSTKEEMFIYQSKMNRKKNENRGE